jgi:hypothetical protein
VIKLVTTVQFYIFMRSFARNTAEKRFLRFPSEPESNCVNYCRRTPFVLQAGWVYNWIVNSYMPPRGVGPRGQAMLMLKCRIASCVESDSDDQLCSRIIV